MNKVESEIKFEEREVKVEVEIAGSGGGGGENVKRKVVKKVLVKKKKKKKKKVVSGSVVKNATNVKKVIKSEAARKAGNAEGNAKAKKFSKPGQRRDTPPRSDPLRMFYESMYVEKKKRGVRSPLAEAWLVTYGVLEDEAARRYLADKDTLKPGQLIDMKSTKSMKTENE
ncbi:hypothetical protein NDN08_003676 [Rhodosorus marinus]|uniref:Uncharacterized protein n=1 Tax=Rhodosorus marinus TaxID=101924 RepID=A0AAV8UYB3_9RHOD|nr:hypothetical protein NDN08_003676 [Rhodosorus marinus]